MRPENPVDWLHAVAETDPDRTLLVTADATFTYGDIRAMVTARTTTVPTDHGAGRLAPVPVRLDTSSVVELLAVTASGRVPVPYVGARPDVAGDASDGDAIVVPTSGSGGAQRLVRLTEANINAAVAASAKRLGNTAADRWLLCLPLNHVGGLSILWRSLAAGGSIAIGPFDRNLSDLVDTAQPTIASLVPTMVSRVLDRDEGLLSHLRFVLVGGGPISRSLVDRARAAGVVVVATYGMTEATSQIATGSPEAPMTLKPLDGVTVHTVDDSGAELPSGAVGRIALDGPSISPGLLDQPERDGAYVTNDVGSVGSDGSLTVIGRVDDIVVTGGENVSLAAIGAALAGFPGVAAAVAIGVSDTEWGTAVVGVVDGSRSPDELASLAREALLPHERPRRWVCVDRLPLLPNGKPDLGAVRAIVTED